MECIGFVSFLKKSITFKKSWNVEFVWACGITAAYRIRIAKIRVQFSAGPYQLLFQLLFLTNAEVIAAAIAAPAPKAIAAAFLGFFSI